MRPIKLTVGKLQVAVLFFAIGAIFGVQVLAGDATMLFYMTEEGSEGKNAFLEKRKPDFSNIKWIP